ncbi:ATP-binding protein [Brevibacillus fulvus]|uniref:Anti-sigma regulatory factor (Ser/Thr protein kinase) n=1 Tax=Brevibacillus fulvus TaxID=1125967 RepID=A0A938XXM0_9BACL|nr:ATP-binding protein [Brevibacillus fulvus]MBM7590034.1 anti-sigma regulatory factor (Ser/Thr protein kinase) [Brevibacillus fulvus]
MGKKVIPPRPITATHLASGAKLKAELRAVSRLTIGLRTYEKWPPGRYEVELSADYRIIGSAGPSLDKQCYIVLDIEKVLRKEDILERLLLEEFHSWHLSHELEPSAILSKLGPEEEKQRELIKQELQKLSILRQLQKLYMFVWEDGQLKSLEGGHSPALNEIGEAAIAEAVEKALGSGQARREQVMSTRLHQIYDVHVLPLNERTCGVVILDVTEAVAAERERQMQEWELYRHVLALVTQGKLVLLRDQQMYQMIKKATHCFTQRIDQPTDLAGLRQKLRESLERFAFASQRVLPFIVAVNEAASNMLKYGNGGVIDLYWSEQEQKCCVVVLDQGLGMVLEELPKLTLQKGYSTRQSMGAGFQVMLQYCDKVGLNSSVFGTRMVLEIVRKKRPV